MPLSSLPRTRRRTRGKHRIVADKQWGNATPPRVIAYAVGVLAAVLTAGSLAPQITLPRNSGSQAAVLLPNTRAPQPQAPGTPPGLTAPEPRMVPGPQPELVANAAPKPVVPNTESSADTEAEPEPVDSTPDVRPSPEPSKPSEPVEPQPPEDSDDSTGDAPPPPPEEPPENEEPPPSDEPPGDDEKQGLLPVLGDVVGGITDPLLGR